MEIDKNDFGLDLFEQGIDHAKGIFEAGHENPPLEVNHGVGLSLGQFSLVVTVARSSGDVVGWAQQAAGAAVAVQRSRLHVLHDFAFVPDMVTGGDNVGSEVEQLLGNRRCYAEPPGSVFSVHDHQVDGALLDHLAQVLADNPSTSLAEYVTDKENAQKTSNERLSANDP